MPFIHESERADPDLASPGQRCFIFYKDMMRRWRDNPRWTTADQIASFIWPDPMKRAQILAFFVFFAFVVLPYERAKREENGDI
jgi:hypothetical protein